MIGSAAASMFMLWIVDVGAEMVQKNGVIRIICLFLIVSQDTKVETTDQPDEM